MPFCKQQRSASVCCQDSSWLYLFSIISFLQCDSGFKILIQAHDQSSSLEWGRSIGRGEDNLNIFFQWINSSAGATSRWQLPKLWRHSGPGIQGQLYLGHRVNNMENNSQQIPSHCRSLLFIKYNHWMYQFAIVRHQENMGKLQSRGKVKVVLVNWLRR